jgi:DNA-binding NarL/FixJ family response regulator
VVGVLRQERLIVVLACSHAPQSDATVDQPPALAADWHTAGLTSREKEVAMLVARGLSNREVAEQLVIAEKTVKNHVQRVLEKLGMRSRSQVAAHAVGLAVDGPQAGIE